MKRMALVCTLALACVVGCGGSDSSGGGGADASTGGGVDAAGGGGGVDASTGSATFTQVYTNVLATKCAPCHTSANGTGVTSGQLDMTSQAKAYADLVGVAAAGSSCSGKGTRVVAGDAASSLLFLKVEPGQGSPCGSKMPQGTSGLSAGDADLIQAWIQAGALND